MLVRIFATDPRRFPLSIMLVLLALCCCSCQSGNLRSSDGSPWPNLYAEDPVIRIQTIHAILGTRNRSNVPHLFPLLNDSDRWVRFNARSAILMLAGDRRDSAPPYDYLAKPQQRRKSTEEFQKWWNEVFLVPAS
ncbi:MAG: hypothetical protein COB10_01305 [Planctomycetota bacterium]|nr:MAG: hypothetical protein COB10_01305 [Planctomycetota bacterium]